MITGAAGGIGVELARRLAADGWRLHLCDVSGARLEDMCRFLPQSTTISESALDTPQACSSALPDSPETIDALVHLAGIFEFHDLDAQGREVYNRTFQHNCLLYTSPSPRDRG